MRKELRVLAVDLGTSRVKVGLVDEQLVTLATSSRSYPTLVGETDQAEQDPADWRRAIHDATKEIVDAHPSARVDAVVLTAQMPTLVALDQSGAVVGNAITWQDSRADSLVRERLDARERRRVQRVAGTPIDGRYILPMHLRRCAQATYEPATLLSAKDYLYFVLTRERVTDPSTASGFGNFDLARGDWSEELTALWGVDPRMLPRVVDPHHSAPLDATGAALLPGVAIGTPVVVGAADSVCAHHFINALHADSLSVIDGSSTVIMASVEDAASVLDDVLVTPLVDPTRSGAEMDLLATGSSISWLARLLELTPAQVEELAVSSRPRGDDEVLFLPYLAGGEQGAIWRSDIAGSIHGLTLGASRADLARALFEGIAIETVRCIEVLGRSQRVTRLVSVGGPESRNLVASLMGGLLDLPVVALAQQSPSLLGAALVALEGLDATPSSLDSLASTILGSQPELEPDYLDELRLRARHYREIAAQPLTPPTREDES